MRIDRAAPLDLLLLGGLLLVTFEDILSIDTIPAYRDLLPFVVPFKHFLAERLQRGELPMWNPWISMGTPFFASLQTGVLYPPSVLLLLPFPLGLNLFLVAHFVIAMLGFWLLARSQSLSRPAAAIGSISFSLGGYLVSMLNLTNHLQTSVWAPWALLFWKRYVDRGGRRALPALVVVLGVALLGGAPEVFLMILCILSAWTALVPPLPRFGRLRLQVLLGIATLLAVGLAAFQIVPTWEYIGESARAERLPADEVMSWSLDPVSLTQLLFPHSVAPPDLGGAGDRRLAIERAEPWIRSIYLGLIPACLVIGGLTTGRERRVWGPMIVAAMVLALGPTTPVLPVLYELFPTLIGKFRYPEKFYFFVHFAAAMLAASSADALFRGDRRIQWAVGAAAAALSSMAALLLLVRWAWPASYLELVASWHGSPLPMTQIVPLALDLAFKARRAILVLGGFLGLLVLQRRSALSPPIASALVVALVACDLASINHGLNRTVSWSALTERAPIVDLAELRASRQRIFDYQTNSIPGQAPQAMLGMGQMIKLVVGSTTETDSQTAWRVLRINIPMVEHVRTLSGIDGIYRRSDEVLNSGTTAVPRDLAVKLLRIFAVEYLIGQSSLDVSGLRHLSTFGDPPIFVYRADTPVPAAYLASRLHPATSDIEAFNQMIRPDFVPATDAVVDEVPSGWQEGAIGETPGEIHVTEWADETVDLDVQAARPVLLVLNDSFFPGWEALVDGSPAKIHRTNSLVRGVFLEAGRHRVQFLYRPKSFTIGVTISLATLMSGIAVASISKRFPPSRTGPSGGLDPIRA